MHWLELRQHGVYKFPDGTQIVACPCASNRHALYYLSDWKLFGAGEVKADLNAPAFRIVEANSAGQIFRFGMPTRWYLNDLTDTGRTM